jgi:hypothetical protein
MYAHILHHRKNYWRSVVARGSWLGLQSFSRVIMYWCKMCVCEYYVFSPAQTQLAICEISQIRSHFLALELAIDFEPSTWVEWQSEIAIQEKHLFRI